jgi:membrane-bound lytic murein transglycosylase B
MLLAGCASPPQQPPPEQFKDLNIARPQPVKPKQPVGFYSAATVTGDYAGYPALSQFIDKMVKEHGFERNYLNGLFSQAKRKQWTLNYFADSDKHLGGKPSAGSWSRYRAKFVDERHISAGIQFWQQHRAALQRATAEYGVPAEYILGILAEETTFGSFVGNHRVLDALTTLGFDFQRRGEYFRGELENFLIMTRDEQIDPVKPVGSFAGAMGLGQFMPTSFLKWAVDFNGDGRRDLWNPDDAIGSVANYFSQHGWQRGKPVVSKAHVKNADIPLEPGLNTEYSLSDLQNAGIFPAEPCQCEPPLRLLLLRHQKNDEYRLGHTNFFVITRYNQSTNYAMVVHELAQAMKAGYQRTASLSENENL